MEDSTWPQKMTNLNMSVVKRTKENRFAPLGLKQGLSCRTPAQPGHGVLRKVRAKSLQLNTLSPPP